MLVIQKMIKNGKLFLIIKSSNIICCNKSHNVKIPDLYNFIVVLNDSIIHEVMLNIIFRKQMKEDSLLSNLSNLSYHANNHGLDFFCDSASMGLFGEPKLKPPVEQQEVDLNCLPNFANNQPNSPKIQGHLLAAYWTHENNQIQGQSEHGSQFPEQQHFQAIKLQQQPLKQEQKPIKVQEGPMKAEIQQDQAVLDPLCDDQIGTIIKNQTKNIPKNYGKAIITYIQKQKANFQDVLRANGIQYQDLLSQLSKKKKYINTIANLRDLWVDFKYARCMRILSNQFLRKYALQYIFNSRICNYTSHVKYRKRLQQAIESPDSFRHIKQY